MNHRIRVAAIIINDQKVLLVKHVDPETGYTWWVPPGGGLEEEDDSLFDCAKREVFEEANLEISLSRIIYIREFLQKNINLEIFTLADEYRGEISIENIGGHGADEQFIKDVAWFSKEDLQHQDMIVFPEILKDIFWDDYRANFPVTRYLGRSSKADRDLSVG